MLGSRIGSKSSRPSTLTIRSPLRNPARSAGEPFRIAAIGSIVSRNPKSTKWSRGERDVEPVQDPAGGILGPSRRSKTWVRGACPDSGRAGDRYCLDVLDGRSVPGLAARQRPGYRRGRVAPGLGLGILRRGLHAGGQRRVPRFRLHAGQDADASARRTPASRRGSMSSRRPGPRARAASRRSGATWPRPLSRTLSVSSSKLRSLRPSIATISSPARMPGLVGRGRRHRPRRRWPGSPSMPWP